ncbi:MAG: peroxiredoxin [Clostridia bacterium]|nr:peroxiredoxin [Clostridia bacterium]
MNENRNNMPMIGSIAPRFVANSTFGPLKITDYIGKWVILFSHPASFTSVCTTEIISFSKFNEEFKKRNCELLGLSVDSSPSHLAWVKDIEKNSGIHVPFPIISDSDRNVSNMYGMIPENSEGTQTVRNVFVIDPNQMIRCILIYPMENGRNISEILRMVDALQMTDNENVSTPANWVPGMATIVPSPQNYNDLMDSIKMNNNKNCMDWYLCFNKENNELRRW